MKRVLLLVIFPFLLLLTGCEDNIRAQAVEEWLEEPDLREMLGYLASDSLAGRMTGEPGSEAAARYIADFFKVAGLRQVPGARGYYQQVPLIQQFPASSGLVTLAGRPYNLGDGMVVVDGGPVRGMIDAEIAVVGYGWIDEKSGHDDYAEMDVNGKVVVTRFGVPNDDSPRAGLVGNAEKARWAKERGALALVEVYGGGFPWDRVVDFANRSRITVDTSSGLPVFWILAPNDGFFKELDATESPTVSIRSSGVSKKARPSNNVIGWVEGSDPQKKDEFVLLTAHYDHVGIGTPVPGAPADSIYNGARDNAMGTVAVMVAAKALASRPPARSVIFMAVTGEEIGLLGSAYYADNPLIPLKNTVFNLNVDGAGYNDTSLVTVIGLERTTADSSIFRGASDFGLNVIKDPVPFQGLFSRSDNVSFARKGVPAPTFSLGFTDFDAEVMKYYHKPTDEAGDVDYDYFLKYTRAYARAARYIADMPERPMWVAGDPFEKAAKSLYGLE